MENKVGEITLFDEGIIIEERIIKPKTGDNLPVVVYSIIFAVIIANLGLTVYVKAEKDAKHSKSKHSKSRINKAKSKGKKKSRIEGRK